MILISAEGLPEGSPGRVSRSLQSFAGRESTIVLYMEGAINRVRVPFERSVINPGRHRKMVCQNVAKGKFTSSL